MKTVKLELDVETARSVLASFDSKMTEKIRERDQLNSEIAGLEERAKSLRAQLHGINGAIGRAGHGDNAIRITEYLSKIIDNKGARMVDIRKATGIGPSSVAFTLNSNKNLFVPDGKLWKLKR